MPQFKDLSTKPTDFNDLAALEGLGAVREQLVGYDGRVELRSAADLYAMKFEDKPVIRGILDEGESLLIVGRSGLGKSLLTLELALRLACPKKQILFNQFEVPQPVKCLLIQSENTAQATNRRLKKMVAYAPELADALPNIAIPFIHNDMRLPGYFTDVQFRQQIIDLIRESQSKVVFIDPLISYHGEDENDNGAMRRSLDIITQIQDMTDTAVVLVHHVGKATNGQQVFAGRGATAIGDWAANILVMHDASQKPELDDENEEQTTKNKTIVRLEHYKQRNHEKQKDIFLQMSEGLIFERTKNPQRTKEQKQTDLIIEALEGLGGEAKSQSQILNWLAENSPNNNFNKSSFYRIIKKMEDENVIFIGTRDGNNQKKIFLAK